MWKAAARDNGERETRYILFFALAASRMAWPLRLAEYFSKVFPRGEGGVRLMRIDFLLRLSLFFHRRPGQWRFPFSLGL